jgi:hypothetical protein
MGETAKPRHDSRQLNIVLQLVGTLGVIGSPIFVGLQVRQNTKATRVQVQENVTNGYISVTQVLIDYVTESSLRHPPQ